MLRNRQNLIQIASEIASARGAPPATVAKELLHAEILYCLVQSGAAEHLTFQGGTCLRLVYGGSRYSEDLDFVGGREFDPRILEPFESMLAEQVFSAYGLELSVRSNVDRYTGEAVSVARWQARIAVPQVDPSLPQKQVINLEVANVPSHQAELGQVRPKYAEISPAFGQIILMVESQNEILADKIVALGARAYLKHRDVWDIEMLLKGGVRPDLDLVRQKVVDYGLETSAFQRSLQERAQALRTEESQKGYVAEMSRFVDGPVSRMLGRTAKATLEVSARLAQDAALQIESRPVLRSPSSGPSFSGPGM